MLQYKETIKSPFPIILKKYILFYALPLILLLPVVTMNVMKLSPHMPNYSGGLLDLYVRCYTGSFLFFVIPVLVFLAVVAYFNHVITIVVRNDRLILPVRTGDWTDGGHVRTIIPLQDIVSIETKRSLNDMPLGASSVRLNSTVTKEYSISCPGYSGDWMVVEYSRPKRAIFRLMANLGGDAKSFECEQIRIEFPSERSEEIKLAIKQ